MYIMYSKYNMYSISSVDLLARLNTLSLQSENCCLG